MEIIIKEEVKMDREQLNSLVEKLMKLDAGKWTKEYGTSPVQITKSYITEIEPYFIFVHSFSPEIGKRQRRYSLNVATLCVSESFDSEREQSLVGELYNYLEQRVGNITEADDPTQKNKDKLLTGLLEKLK